MMPAEGKSKPLDISQRFTTHLRRTSTWHCRECLATFKAENHFRSHIFDHFPDLPTESLEDLVSKARGAFGPQLAEPPHAVQPRQPPSPKRSAEDGVDNPHDAHERKRVKSPELLPQSASSPSTSRHFRSRATRNTQEAPDFESVPRQPAGKLWDATRPALTRPAITRGQGLAAGRMPPSSGQPYRRPKGGGLPPPDYDVPETDDNVRVLIKQPMTRPITQEQLVAEVKGIYAGLVMVESKCIEVDNAQNAMNHENSPPLNRDQWQALIALHRTLLHEHHDFFLASQHPSASEALRRLADKYAMPARMWRHGIHSFLELLRHRLPGALEYMQTFIYLAYSMMALLYETVPAFEETWIECLGDLSRYRMAIEDDDMYDREVWTAVSRSWYSKASDKTPTTGRLHHHLAILARPNAALQLFYYVKSLSVATPFKSARESILTLFEPVMSGIHTQQDPLAIAFVKCHSVFFTDKHKNQLDGARAKLAADLDLAIARAPNWAETGYIFGITNISACFEYGAPTNVLMQAVTPASSVNSAPSSNDEDGASDTSIEDGGDQKQQHQNHQQQQQQQQQQRTEETVAIFEPSQRFQDILAFSESIDNIVFGRLGDPNILAYLHVRVAFMRAMTSEEAAIAFLESSFPWAPLALALNSFLAGFKEPERFQVDALPGSTTGRTKKPLPEDWAMRGLFWADNLFPTKYFEVTGVEDDERTFETPSMVDQRQERCFWNAWHIAKHNRWLLFNPETNKFRVADAFAKTQSATALPAPAAWSYASRADAEKLPDAEALLAGTGHPLETADAMALAQASPSSSSRPTVVQDLREGRFTDISGGSGPP